MLPVQILLNNLLYAVSEMPIPLDEVDREITERPEHWDMRFIRNFMLVLGPVSSIFDFLTFGLLLLVFHASEALFQTGWFIESLATQVLVIFVLRTRRNPLQSHPTSPPCHHLTGSRRDCRCAAIHAAGCVVRLCSALCRLPLGDCAG